MNLIKIFRSITVEPILFLYMLAIEYEIACVKLSINTIPCIMDNLCNGPNSTITRKDISEEYFYYSNILLSTSQFIILFFSGSWSDQFGRKFPIYLAIITSAISQIFYSLYLITSAIYYIYIASFLSGIGGGTFSLLAASFGYIADITSNNLENRSARFTLLEAMLFSGRFMGSSIMSISTNMEIPLNYHFIIIAIIHLTLILYMLFALKENKPRENLSLKLIDLSYTLKTFRVLTNKRDNPKDKWKIIISCICTPISLLVISSIFNLLFLYLKDNWNSSTYFLLETVYNLSCGIVLLLIVPILKNISVRFIKEEFLIKIAFLCKGIGFILLGMSKKVPVVFVSMIILSIGELSNPAIKSFLSKAVASHEKGSAFGLLSITKVISFQLSTITFIPLAKRIKYNFAFISVGVLQLVPYTIFLIFSFENDDDKRIMEEERINNS